MRNRFNKGGLPLQGSFRFQRGLPLQRSFRFLGIIVAVVVSMGLFLHFSLATHASAGPLRWESSSPGITLDGNNRVTLTFTLVGGDGVVGDVTGAAFTLVAPMGGWTVVSSSGFDMPPDGAPIYVGGALGYVAMGNILEGPIVVPHEVVLTLQFAPGVNVEDGVLFDVVGRFDHGGPPILQSTGSPDGGTTIFPESTDLTQLWRLVNPNNIQIGREYIVVSEHGALTNAGMIFHLPAEGREDPTGMTITPVTTAGEWVTSEVTPEMIWQFGQGNNTAAAAGGLGAGVGFHLFNDAPGEHAGRFPLRRDGSMGFPTAPIMTTSATVPNNQSLLLHVLSEAERTVSLYFWSGNNAWNFALEGTPLGFTARGASSNAAQLMPFLQNAPLRLYERMQMVPQHSIVATAGAYGEISPTSLTGHVWVDEGADQTFTLLPAFGFVVDTVLVNSEPVTVTNNTFTFTNVTTGGQTIHATFKPDPAAVEIPFIVWNDNFASGEFTTAVIIDLGEDYEALGSALSPDMFTVHGENRRAFGSTAITSSGYRRITRVYANDTPTVRGYLGFNTNSPDFQEGLERGRYIVIEFEFWTAIGGQTTLSASESTNQFYRVAPRSAILLAGGGSIDLMFFTQSDVVNPLIDKFVRVPAPANGALYLHRDAEGNVVQNLPMFVYVHGMGRGGTQAVNDFTAPLKSPSGAMALMSRMHDPIANADGKFDSHVFAVAYGGAGGGFNQANVINAIRNLITEGYVNPDRVFVSGFSMGGSHTHALINNNGGFFAAAAPLAPVGGYPTAANAYRNADLAYWVLVNRNDAAMYQTGVTNWRNAVLTPTERMHSARASRFETNPVLVWPENQSTVIHGPHELEAAVFYNRFKDVNVDGTPWDLVPVAQSARFGSLPVDVFQRTNDPEVLAAWAAHVAQWDEYPDLLHWIFSQCQCDVCDICHPGTHNVPFTAVVPSIEDSTAWDRALTLSLGEHTRRSAIHPEGMPTATGEARLLWDDENLYVRVVVDDATPFTDGDAHTVDGAEIFLGETGVRRAMTGQNPVWQNQYRLARSGQYSSRWITATTALIGREDWRRQVINNDEDGYIVFMAIPLKYNNGPVTGQMMLFDIMLNDANDDTATRTAEISIFDVGHNGFSNSNGWGEIVLRGGPTNRQAIVVTYGAGGAITPANANANVWVPTGADQTFTITPALGYVIDDVLVNGETVGAVASYTFENVNAAGSIHATFRRAENVTEFPFIVYNDVFADGEFTTAVIIDLGEGRMVNTADLNPSMFTVSARNTGLNGVLAFAGTRNITRVYANTVQDVIGYITPMPGFNADADVPVSGRFIVVEMEFFSPAGGLAHGGLTRNGAASMILNYSILANTPLTLANGDVISALGFNQSAVVSPVLDQFVEGRYIPDTGAQIPYTVFFNQEADEPLPMFIYLHGGGRGPDLWAPLRSANGGTMAATPYHQARNPMHVIVPQGNLFAGTGADTAAHIQNRTNLLNLIQSWADDGLVDMDQIFVSGFSMGGMGTLGFVRTHGEYIAAAVPIAGAAPPNAAMLEANPAMTSVSLWSFRHRGETNVANTRGWEEFFVTGPGVGWANGNATTLNSNAVLGFPYFGYGWTAHESEAAVFGNKIGDIAASFAYGPDQEPYRDLYIFDWMNAQTRRANTLTFHLYTANPTILAAFDDYATGEVDGRPVIVVTVQQGTAIVLGDVLNLGHIYGTSERHGYAFWGWFDDEMLDESERVREGLRRPALVVPNPEEDTCLLADILDIIENGTEAEFLKLFTDGNLDLYGVWVRFGDVDDNGVLNMADLNLLQRHINFGHMMPVELSGAAADVAVDGIINMADLSLLQRHINFGHIIQVILGEEPQP